MVTDSGKTSALLLYLCFPFWSALAYFAVHQRRRYLLALPVADCTDVFEFEAKARFMHDVLIHGKVRCLFLSILWPYGSRCWIPNIGR